MNAEEKMKTLSESKPRLSEDEAWSQSLERELSPNKNEDKNLSEKNDSPHEENAPRDAASEEEISEEEALEKLPFEDVEGLSASDLDYLSQKEKEHRRAQEQEDGDVSNPAELKTTLERQSTQLEGALQSNPSPTTDEKQEILRRLKKMMEEER
jgi:hypothetical protein